MIEQLLIMMFEQLPNFGFAVFVAWMFYTERKADHEQMQTIMSFCFKKDDCPEMDKDS